MSKKKGHRKIDLKKVFSICMIIALAIIGYRAMQFKMNQSFAHLDIHVVQPKGVKTLLNKARVQKIVRAHLGFDPAISNIKNIDFRSLEEHLEAHKYIKSASVYLNGKHELKILVQTRMPIARVKTAKADYYVARDGTRMPLGNYPTIRVPLVTGHLKYIHGKDKAAKASYPQFVQLLNKIKADALLEALIEQIDISPNGKVVFIPKLGSERIIFGNLDEQEEKLAKLIKYYKWGKREDGWDQYAYLNLEYKNQIALGK